jgi:hypothetical protein
VLDLGAVLLGTRALAGVGLEGHHDLVHQRFVVVTTEHGLGRVDLGRGLALVVQEFELHQLAPFSGLGLDGRTDGDEAALRAGHGTLDQQQLTGFVDADTGRGSGW